MSTIYTEIMKEEGKTKGKRDIALEISRIYLTRKHHFNFFFYIAKPVNEICNGIKDSIERMKFVEENIFDEDKEHLKTFMNQKESGSELRQNRDNWKLPLDHHLVFRSVEMRKILEKRKKRLNIYSKGMRNTKKEKNDSRITYYETFLVESLANDPPIESFSRLKTENESSPGDSLEREFAFLLKESNSKNPKANQINPCIKPKVNLPKKTYFCPTKIRFPSKIKPSPSLQTLQNSEATLTSPRFKLSSQSPPPSIYSKNSHQQLSQRSPPLPLYQQYFLKSKKVQPEFSVKTHRITPQKFPLPSNPLGNPKGIPKANPKTDRLSQKRNPKRNLKGNPKEMTPNSDYSLSFKFTEIRSKRVDSSKTNQISDMIKAIVKKRMENPKFNISSKRFHLSPNVKR